MGINSCSTSFPIDPSPMANLTMLTGGSARPKYVFMMYGCHKCRQFKYARQSGDTYDVPASIAFASHKERAGSQARIDFDEVVQETKL